MSLTVNTNMAALVAQRSLFNANTDLGTSMQRLSTGIRINSAGDDAAGLSLSKKITVQVSAAEIAKQNAQTGINMIQTAESDLDVIQNNLQRMRDLSVQAANGVYSTAERKMINAEFVARSVEIDRIAKSSSFSDKKLLDSSVTGANLYLQVGTNATADDRIDVISAFKNFTGTSGNMLGVTPQAITTVAFAYNAISAIDKAMTTVSTTRGSMGAMINRLQGSITRIDTRKENMNAAFGIITDADIARESADLTRNQILKQTAISMLQQANSAPQAALTLLR
ncbi:MAG: flagellin [bacterium]